MKFCFVGRESFSSFCEKERPRAELVCFPFSGVGLVNYEKELKGETSVFEDIAIYSKQENNIAVCGCYTDSRGILKKSVVVAEKGRVLGVSDRVHSLDREDYKCGAWVRIYNTSIGKLGVIVGEDLYFPQVLQTLSVCGAEIALCVFEKMNDSLEVVLAKAGAFLYGVPVCLCANGYSAYADIDGKLKLATPDSPVTFDFEKRQEYHLVETRQRGFYKK